MPWFAAVLLMDALRRLQRTFALEAACALYVQYDGYLRPSEVLGLSAGDVVRPAPSAGRAYAHTAVIIRQQSPDELAPPAKNGEFDCTVHLGWDEQRPGIRPLLTALTLRAKRRKR